MDFHPLNPQCELGIEPDFYSEQLIIDLRRLNEWEQKLMSATGISFDFHIQAAVGSTIMLEFAAAAIFLVSAFCLRQARPTVQ